ncbi:MAG TPA: PHB depolymerase family esterase [Candidatus Limnocylindria bacterium]|nr:PHB depolymerase family esterase [Candidatus Limnocylindria bacterium]
MRSLRSVAPSLLILALAACGGAAQSADGNAEPSSATAPTVSAAVSASAAPATALSVKPMGTTGAPLGYLEYLPPGYGTVEPAPLLVFLHGAGEAGDGSEESMALVDDLGVPQLISDGEWSDEQPFVVLAPQYATRYAEGECGFGEDLAAFIDFAVEHYEVDPKRVYLTGVSCGAIGVWDYLASYGDAVVAAVVPISGHAMWALEKTGCEPLAEVPVWVLNAADDEVIPIHLVEEQVQQIRDCAGAGSVEAELTVYPDSDHVGAIGLAYAVSAGNDIYTWLLEHVHEPTE